MPASSSQILTSGTDGTVRLWEPATGTARVFDPDAGPIAKVTMFDGDHFALVHGSDAIVAVDLYTGARIPMPGVRGAVATTAAAGSWAAAAGSDRIVRLWEPRTGRTRALRQLYGASYVVTALAFSGDGATLAVADDAGNVVLWPVDAPGTFAPLETRMSALTSARLDGGRVRSRELVDGALLQRGP